MIYHTDFEGQKFFLTTRRLLYTAGASLLLIFSLLSAGSLAVFYSFFSFFLFQHAIAKEVMKEVVLENLEGEEILLQRVFPMLWYRKVNPDHTQGLVLSSIKWAINPASWVLSLLILFRLSLLKTSLYLINNLVERDTLADWLLKPVILVFTVINILLGLVSVSLEGLESLCNGPYWLGYGLAYVCGFRPPFSLNPMAAASSLLYRRMMKISIGGELDLKLERTEAAELLVVEEAKDEPLGEIIKHADLEFFNTTLLGKNKEGHYTLVIRCAGSTYFYQMLPAICIMDGVRIKAVDMALPAEIEAWEKEYELEFRLEYLTRQRETSKNKMEAVRQLHLAQLKATFAADLAQRRNTMKVDLVQRAADLNRRVAFLTKMAKEYPQIPELVGEAQLGADEAQKDVDKAGQEAEKARKEANSAQAAAEKLKKAYGQQFQSTQEGQVWEKEYRLRFSLEYLTKQYADMEAEWEAKTALDRVEMEAKTALNRAEMEERRVDDVARRASDLAKLAAYYTQLAQALNVPFIQQAAEQELQEFAKAQEETEETKKEARRAREEAQKAQAVAAQLKKAYGQQFQSSQEEQPFARPKFFKQKSGQGSEEGERKESDYAPG